MSDFAVVRPTVLENLKEGHFTSLGKFGGTAGLARVNFGRNPRECIKILFLLENFLHSELMVKSSSAAPPAFATPASYEAAMAELDALVQQMEGGALSLEASLSSYQRGAELIKYCQQALSAAEAQVKILDGELMKPFLNSGNAAGE